MSPQPISGMERKSLQAKWSAIHEMGAKEEQNITETKTLTAFEIPTKVGIQKSTGPQKGGIAIPRLRKDKLHGDFEIAVFA